MKIILLSYFFEPEITPRAFRAGELAKEFSRQKHQVKVYVPDNHFVYSADEWQNENLSIIKVKSGFFLNKNAKKHLGNSRYSNTTKKNRNLALRYSIIFVIKKIFHFFYLGGKSFEFAITLALALKKNKEKNDILISIGLPISVHLSVAIIRFFKHEIAGKYIADYGDPFSSNKGLAAGGMEAYYEKFILHYFDFITIPTEKAINSFKKFKTGNRIQVIPQGMNFSDIKIAEYVKGPVPKFAYAGVFYKIIRNPNTFFEYLIGMKEDFLFVLFTDLKGEENIACIDPYLKRLAKKIVLNDLLPRNQCISELSKYDFLINIGNTSAEQVPSKLIDYSLTRRPILTFKADAFNPKDFEDFVSGNYKNQTTIDISNFDIRKVASRFIELEKA
jgi:hypothetical protein